jgi:exportin-7
MKANFQLKQIIKCPVYGEWINLVAGFTTKSFQAWQWAPNSVYYLLSLWSRLVASIAYLQQNEDTKLEGVAPTILEAYVQSRLGSVEAVVRGNGGVEDPLEAPSLREEMEALPTLGRLKFAISSNMLTNLFDPLAAQYEGRLLSLTKPEAFLLESKLTWMVQVIAAILGGRLATSSSPEADRIDGELSARLFRLMKLHDQRVQSQGFSPSNATPRLELALLRFLQEFRKVYIGDYATAASSIYTRLSDILGLADPNAVLALILQKICNNLRFWAKNRFIVDRTLALCNTISSGYSSGKMLRKVELTSHLFAHHTSQYFPFLDVPANSRGRTHFYNTLAKLLFLDVSIREFNAFMAPFSQVFLRLLSINNPEQFRLPVVMNAVTGLLRDMRGIVDATVSGTTYNMFFEWIYESKAPNGARFSDTLVRIADVFYDVPEVTNPLLKFVAEFVLNKSSRVAFDSSSPNGILLFRLASEVVCSYGKKIYEAPPPPPTKAYNNRYKGIWICLKILRNALQGGFVNYGVFQLYNDPALSNALSIVFKLMFSVPLNQVMSYPKFTEAHFAFLDTLCSEHTATVATLDQQTFRQMLESFKEGLGALDQAICSHCCSSVDKLADFYYHNLEKNNAVSSGIKTLVQEQMGQFNDLLAILFQILCFEPQCLFQWSISRPMLSLIVINPGNFNALKAKLCNQMLTQEMGLKMQEALAELMIDVEPNLTGKNRDLFTQRLSLFRHAVQSILNQ